VTHTKSHHLEAAIHALQQKFGGDVVRPLTELRAARPGGISTGFPHLDAVLAPGLIPVGVMTELFGRPTSGMTSLAYRIIQQAQASNRYAIYIDLDGTFAPEPAARGGVALDRLILAHPEHEPRALDLARDLLASAQIGIIVLDVGQLPADADRLYRLTSFLLHAQCVLLRLELLPTGSSALPIASSPAGLRLLVKRADWLYRFGDVVGCRSSVSVLKGRHGMGHSALLDLYFEGQEAGADR
jgi:hypothetical protein